MRKRRPYQFEDGGDAYRERKDHALIPVSNDDRRKGRMPQGDGLILHDVRTDPIRTDHMRKSDVMRTDRRS
ncbi:MAG: hypothetical protein A9Z00_10140 [Thermobacillus sp. ZCTH02-B1]|nr:MAG: hypothetical protein A9Z00_10140 [Thermobacillus sp. ZCTH02-B1]